MARFVRIYRRVLGFLAPYRWTTLVLCLANVVLAACGFLEPMLFGRVVQSLGADDPAGQTILAWAGLGLLGIFAGMGTALVADRLAHRLRLRVMGEAYSHVLQLPAAFNARYPTSTVTKTLWSGTDEMFGLWLGLFREHLTTALCLLGLMPVALYLNPPLGAVLFGLALLFGVTVALTIKRTEAGQRRAEDAHVALSAQVGDVLGNAQLVRSFGAAPAEAEAFGTLAQDVLRHQFPVLGWWAGVTVMTRAGSTVATLAVVGLGAWLHSHGRASMADVVTFMGLAGMLIGRLESALWMVARSGPTLTRLEDFFAMMDASSTVPDLAARRELQAGPGRVEFHGVRFGYPGGPNVLEGVDFVAEPGETVALVGPTGSGKSTVMALLQRLWDPAEGEVLIDGCDLREASLASVRAAIGTVPQESLLLNRTIAENLRLGRPDATDAEVEAAARLAEAHDFIMRQQHGYRTVVGERGTALSGGQRQRLAIARALLRNPRILVLDEATSALDGVTEEKVVRAMKAAAKGRTTFVIAHRLATIRDADRILYFRDGAVAESGTFEQLVARGGGFAELARTQLLAPEGKQARLPRRKQAGRPRLVWTRADAPAPQDNARREQERLAN